MAARRTNAGTDVRDPIGDDRCSGRVRPRIHTPADGPGRGVDREEPGVLGGGVQEAAGDGGVADGTAVARQRSTPPLGPGLDVEREEVSVFAAEVDGPRVDRPVRLARDGRAGAPYL